MKTKSDFVTNSSSTSYCIVGVNPTKIEMSEEVYSEGQCEKYDKLGEDCGLSVGIISEWCGAVGLSIGEMKDFETLREFKLRALQAINNAVGEAEQTTIDEIRVIHDGGYDE